MNELFNLLAKIGGILALIVSLAVLFFREYIKAKVTDVFATRLEQRRNKREDEFLLNQVTTHVRGEVIQELVDARLRAIERVAECAWAVGAAATAAGAAKELAMKTHQNTDLIAELEKNADLINKLSSAIASGSPHLPDETTTVASDFYRSSLALIRVFADKEKPYSIDQFNESWQLEKLLQENLKAAIISTVKLPEAIKA